MMMLVKILLYYVIAMAVVYVFSDLIIYQPPSKTYTDNDNVIKLKSANGKLISAIYLPNPEAKYTILFSHGNAEDLQSTFHRMRLYQKRGFAGFSFDYQGYGTSEGRPSEKKVYADITAAYNYMVDELKIPPERILVQGHSLGSGPALELATNKKIAGLILESPFVTAFRVISYIPLFPVDKFRNNEKIIKLKVPVLILHGTKDRVIPFWHGKKMYELANEPKHKLWIESGDHNDLLFVAEDDYWKAIDKFLEDVER